MEDWPEDGGWLSGWIWCGTCGTEWVGVAPRECGELECPRCGGMRGHFYPPRGSEHDQEAEAISRRCAELRAVYGRAE
jgi:hypothetical protein